MRKTPSAAVIIRKPSQNSLEIHCQAENLDALLQKEWLRTNRLGAYSSSTVIGCNTRRYHGLLIGAAAPPVGRILALATIMEQLVVGDKTYDLATNEFPNTFSPRGFEYLKVFRDEIAVEFVYDFDGVELIKRVLLADEANAVTVRYKLTSPGSAAKLLLRPFVAMRDFHALRSADKPHRITFNAAENGIVIRAKTADPPLQLSSERAAFQADPQWWYHFQYRADVGRGQGGAEDLYCPGVFTWTAQPGEAKSCEVIASLGQPTNFRFEKTLSQRRREQDEFAKAVKPLGASAKRLARSAGAFIVNRATNAGCDGASILAGFPWFADWGRDTFIALPGLLLTTGQFATARKVLGTYAGYISKGMIPNRFDDYGKEPHFNSIDASLWFIIAAERFVRACDDDDNDDKNDKNDKNFWAEVLCPACEAILASYRSGTRFGIHADTDGLLTGGSYHTQLTWMDAKLGEEVITGRYGKAVEVNALWHSAHSILARRYEPSDPIKADDYARKARQIGESFVTAFWNEPFGWLNDCVNDAGWDASLRPNQILAVSLPHSPLPAAQQRSVVRTVRETLLTPMGLRTLARRDPRYRSQYVGSWESRDRAYHQGTVWAWLIGPFIEAFLKVADPAERAGNAEQAKRWLAGFDEHLDQAGLGFISEIFDGDAPHTPRGCYGQAWSVAEVLRAKALVAEYEKTE